MLDTPVIALKGIGAARAALLEKLGAATIRELLLLMPREYQDFSRCTPVCALEHGQLAAVQGRVLGDAKLLRPRGGLQMVTATVQDETGKAQLVWFNQPYRKNQVHSGENCFFCGRVDKSRGVKLVNPMAAGELPGILAVYPLVQGLNQTQVRSAVAQALRMALGNCKETLPQAFRQSYQLCELNFALENLHQPKDWTALEQARRRLSFEDMLQYMLAVAMLRQERSQRGGISFQSGKAREHLVRTLPFSLTQGQQRLINEIGEDMARPFPMNRLIQGDVGSGKTVLALFAMAVALENGYQAVMMAPTEILARQHYRAVCRTFGENKCCLVLGGMKKKEREQAYARVASGEAQAIVGTHALLQEGVAFDKLGLVVTDEQHRFGVRQRAKIAEKAQRPNERGLPPDVLIMSATPIPRTLSLIMYGDLDVSILDELPPGRKSIRTRLVPQAKRQDMYHFIQKEALAGRQAYVVCPLVDPSEELPVKSVQALHQELCQMLPELHIGLLHGRMAGAKKEEVIAAFRAGEIQVLVSTTVVEVGVDVPNACIMAIEDADRFGLAQLHQLRGRVGRGGQQSYCFLLSGVERAQERLETLVQTEDGFKIAQRDLELRGPGEFLGTRQHGIDAFSALRMASSLDVLQDAQRAGLALARAGEQPGFESIFARARAVYEQKMREIAQN